MGGMSWNEEFERTLREEREERWRKSENTPALPEEPRYEQGIFLRRFCVRDLRHAGAQRVIPPAAPPVPKRKDVGDHMEKLDNLLEDDPIGDD
jgi:hypothetical protein